MTPNRIIIWDGASEPDSSLVNLSTLIIRWRGFATHDKNDISLISEIEKNSDEIKSVYVTFIDHLYYQPGMNNFLQKKLKSVSGHNLWWMSLVNEKSPYRNESVLNCLKLIALEKVINQYKTKDIEVYSQNKKLLKSLRFLFKNQQIKEKRLKQEITTTTDAKKIAAHFPQFVQGLVYLIRYFLKTMCLKLKEMPSMASVDNILVSNLYNLDGNELKKNKIKLKQWEELPQLLGQKTLFLNHLITSPQIPNAKVAQDVLNKNDSNNQHFIIDSFFNLKMLLHIFFGLVKINAARPLLKNKMSFFFKDQNSKVNFWYFLQNDFLSSLFGSTWVMNQIWDLQFSQITESLSHFKGSVFYLCENQGWERSLIYNARQNMKKAKIVAVPHSTVRYWDIKYALTHQGFKNRNQIADYYALNGPPALKEFQNSGYDKNTLIPVEALRYQYLLKFIENNKNESKHFKILFLGDYSKVTTEKILNVLKVKLNDFKKAGYSLYYKAHPFCPKIDLGNSGIKIIEGSLSDFIEQFDIVIISNSTSACLDAYISGRRVIIFLDENDLNHSPMRGSQDVTFTTYADFLNMGIDFSDDYRPSEKYFWLSKNFNYWHKFLNELKDFL